jgi:hypothetical protein
MDALNQSSFPFPSQYGGTPNNRNTSPQRQSLAPGAPIRPSTSRGRTETVTAARRITFEREELDDDDEDEEDDQSDLTLNTTDIEFLNTQNKLIIAEYNRLSKERSKEHQRALISLFRLRRMDNELLDLQTRSWYIARDLGRIDRSDYIGL